MEEVGRCPKAAGRNLRFYEYLVMFVTAQPGARTDFPCRTILMA
jgi:hypothetical protein